MKIDLIGKHFGRLIVIEKSKTDKHGKIHWKCQCICGEIVNPTTSDLVSGNTSSCGCLRLENLITASVKHKKKNTRLYSIWQNMKERCINSNSVAFKDYGGRGITICDEWKDNFQAFYDWAMANGYTKNLTIDRIDNDGNYEPSNCRWSTMKEQANNRRNCLLLEYNGTVHTLQEWSEYSGIRYHTLYYRYKVGKTPAEILKN